MTISTPCPSPIGAGTTNVWCCTVVALLSVIHAVLAVDTLRRKSVTVDEVGHLPAGISYWQKGTFEQYHHNPPLVKLLAALPALAIGPTVDYSKSWEVNRARGTPLSPWAFGWEFMYANAARYHDIYFWARLPVVGLSVLAGVVIFLWARELFGPWAGVVAVMLWTFCPNAIAHAGMVTTDMGATSLGFIATYFFWRYLRRPTWARAGVVGVVLGLAELTKFSSLLLYLLWSVLWLCYRFQRREPAGVRETSRGLTQMASIVGLSVLVINLGYGFEGTFTRLGDYTFFSRTLTRARRAADPAPAAYGHPWGFLLKDRINRFAGTPLASLPFPVPRHYLEGFDEQKLESEGINGQGYPVYLCGELRRTGWWWYYFFALALKVPLGTWVLSLVAVVIRVFGKFDRASLLDEFTLLAVPVAVVVVMSFLTDINLGLRYVLPIFPFWFVAVSRVGCVLQFALGPVSALGQVSDRAHNRRGRETRAAPTRAEPATLTRSASEGDPKSVPRSRFGLVSAAVVAALTWNVVAAVRSHPHHLAYFNELVGGRANGHKYLIDSNLDWGQDLLGLARWLRENRPGERIGLAYFGNVDPSILAASGERIEFRLAPPRSFDDLTPRGFAQNQELSDAIVRWMDEHRQEAAAWSTEHRQDLWHMPAFREFVTTWLDVQEGPQPGLFAISANLLHGLPFRFRDHQRGLWDFARGPSGDTDPYGYFRELTPLDVVGGSIFIFDVTEEQANDLRAKLGLPPVATRSTPPRSGPG